MSCNLIKKYVDFKKNNFTEYTKMIMGNYYDEAIFNKYLDKYVGVRYYNDELEIRATLEYNLNYYLNKIYEKDTSVVSEFIRKLFVLYYYIDDVVVFDVERDLSDFVSVVTMIREDKVGIKDENFSSQFSQLILDNNKRLSEYINSFDSHEFYLKLSQISSRDLYNVELRYEIEIPKLYSKYAINKIWGLEQISEDKLKIEYYLVNQLILKDIINGVFKNNYLVEFRESLFKKVDKLEQLLEIFNNPIAKELITIKINYEDFISNRELVLNYIKDGYGFAVILDEKYKGSNDVNILDIFKYIIVNRAEDVVSMLKYKSNLIILE